MKTARIIYWIVTGLLCLMMLASAAIYIFNHDEAAKVFTSLSYPAYLIYPLAAAKIPGVEAIVIKNQSHSKNELMQVFSLVSCCRLQLISMCATAASSLRLK